jgi:hypothetical protein
MNYRKIVTLLCAGIELTIYGIIFGYWPCAAMGAMCWWFAWKEVS